MIKVGTRVEFNPKVYRAPYAPYYDRYQGEIFEVVAIYTEEPYGDVDSPHIKLKCVSDAWLEVYGNVHPDELEEVL